ncbi:hypothetical protein BCV69DRAFT_281942 [Microstroma glucosiphilum]|uniref:Inositol hexakisphosphate-domain-containing protein n=1 Tax=Pseudomicrostroma glucosiphilum TaxID=1684307 RepID=A0A316UA35_9BASI|nr:hypothetical protein BCV69DRAFT_281942 [Pseudomicrostroma glucosiphilum]PWN22032.1 hypothetical protein BCV69DRAFT_281942 [Pseudomicrostroma glucosiphilum]
MASDDPQRSSIHAALQEPPHDVQLPPAPSPPSQPPHVRFGGADGHSQVQDDLAALKDVKAKLSSYTTLWSAKARETTVVRGRQGSVLTRGLVLKTDQFQGTRVQPASLDLSLQGAPCFRKADTPTEVYGVAQPTITGIKTILTVLEVTPLNPMFTPSNGTASRQWTRSASHSEATLASSSPRPSFISPPLKPHKSGSRHVSGTLSPGGPHSYDNDALGGRRSSNSTPPARSPNLGPQGYHAPQQEPRQAVWFCTRDEPVLYIGARPFVLREHSNPASSFSLSSRAENLQAIETRLKADVIREASRFGGLIMCHEEEGGYMESEGPSLKPTWIAVDEESVKTIKEVFDDLRSQGWRVDYHRVPIGQDQPIEHNYLDAYTRILRNLDPLRTCVVANCGAGFTRTTFAMVAAQIVRRRQLILLGKPDPFDLTEGGGASLAEMTASPRPDAVRRNVDNKANASMAKRLRATYEKQVQAQALLRLVKLLGTAGSTAPVDLLLGSPGLLDPLRRALVGDLNIVRALCGILDEGLDDKVVVDVAIDSAAHLTNLREEILLNRASYALAGSESNNARSRVAALQLDKAVRALEKYFFLCAFASYVSGSQSAIFEHSFADWLKKRSEVWNTVKRIRSKGRQLYLFDPVHDLSQLTSAPSHSSRSAIGLPTGKDQMTAGDEFAQHHVSTRAGIVLRPGTLLKEDIWQAQRAQQPHFGVMDVPGAINLRRVPNTSIWATGQPSVNGIRNVLRSIGEQLGHSEQADADKEVKKVGWINLREEPILFVSGKPYVLRDSTLSLRNIKAYGGISWTRLQMVEARLKQDVINELEQNDGRLLLHSEDENGTVYPVWAEVQADDVQTLQDVMATVAGEIESGTIPLGPSSAEDAPHDAGHGSAGSAELMFRRIPLTAEKSADLEDVGSILETVLRAQGNLSSIVINCQLGRGRSTLASVIVLLISQWLHKHSSGPSESQTSRLAELDGDDEQAEEAPQSRPRLSYHLINSLLRVTPYGLQVKETVDDAVDRAGSIINLRDSIEESRLAAEEIEDPESPQRKAKISAGCQALKRYYSLIVFQAYLNATTPDTIDDMPTFESFVRRQPVLSTISKEFDKVSMALITPLQRIEAADGMALDDEVNEVVANRHGSILTAYTMLKSDFFSGIAKVSLSQIEGIPNLRSVPLLIAPSTEDGEVTASDQTTYGSGMPSIDGLRRGLNKMGCLNNGDATNKTSVYWTSLREEPVCYVRGRPHVLRLADQPLTNLEATGITTETVERQEIALKNDVLQEAASRDGRILLHDEVEIEPGKFDIIPVWESIKPGDVLTPREVYELVQREGYRVDYARVAVTDEQAPVPAVFSEIEQRVLKALKDDNGGHGGHSITAFNCQMGRGRTTTGMVIASLISTVHHYGEELLNADMGASIALSNNDEDLAASITGGPRMDGAKDFLDNREDELWLQGEYRSILQLVGVLSHGKLAKRLVDSAIDRMEAVQNLRKAIYDSKMRAENAEPGSTKRRHLTTVWTNYLQRYAHLIAFCNYLIEKKRAQLEEEEDGGDGEEVGDGDESVGTTAGNTSVRERIWGGGSSSQFPSFLTWLKPRREVESIIKNQSS